MEEFELSLDSINDVTEAVQEIDDDNVTLESVLSSDEDPVENNDDTSEENNTEEEEEESSSEEESSVDTESNIYKLASALKEEGIFDEDDNVDDVDSPEAFKSLMENHIQKRLSERHKRIENALDSKVPTDIIRNYEGTLNYLSSLTADRIREESEQGDKLRKQLLFQDYINRGFTEEKARKEVKKAFDAGSDIEDAIEAWQSNYDFFKNSYDREIEYRHKEAERLEKESKQRVEAFRKELIDSKDAFGGMEVDKNTRQKIFNLIYNPTVTADDGKKVSEMTKFFKEHPTDVYKYMAYFYDATDKFTNFNKLFKKQVNKEMKKGLAKLEETINGSSRTSSGSLNLSNGRGGKTEGTLFNNNWDLDL